jgi:bacteriocin-like protein
MTYDIRELNINELDAVSGGLRDISTQNQKNEWHNQGTAGDTYQAVTNMVLVGSPQSSTPFDYPGI